MYLIESLCKEWASTSLKEYPVQVIVLEPFWWKEVLQLIWKEFFFMNNKYRNFWSINFWIRVPVSRSHFVCLITTPLECSVVCYNETGTNHSKINIIGQSVVIFVDGLFLVSGCICPAKWWLGCTIPPVHSHLSLSLSDRSSIPPSPWLTNTGAAFQQCPLSKHRYCGVLLPLLCQTKAPCQWNNPAGRRPSPGSFRAAGPHQNSRPDSPSLAMIAGQEKNLYISIWVCVCVCVSAGSKLNPKFTRHAHLFTRQTDLFFPGIAVGAKLPSRSELYYIFNKLEHTCDWCAKSKILFTFTAALESVACVYK